MTIATQDLTYLTWDEHDCPSGLGGKRLKAREGTGANAVYYTLPSCNEQGRLYGHECVNEIISTRLMDILGIPHVACSLIHADVLVGGTVQNVWLTRTRSIRKHGEQTVPLGLFVDAVAGSSESPLDLCFRMGWGKQIGQLFFVDFLTANRGRTAKNLNVLQAADGTFSLAPFTPAADALTSVYPGNAWLSYPLADIRTTNYLGSASLLQNLERIPENLRFPAVQDQYRGQLLKGLRQAEPNNSAMLQGAWQIIKRRWRHCESLCDL